MPSENDRGLEGRKGSGLARREFIRAAAAVVPTLATTARPGTRAAPADTQAWSGEWDRELIRTASQRLDAGYDAAEAMLSRPVGAAYNYHSGLRSAVVHPTRDSIEYALLLLEAGGEPARQRAHQIVGRVVDLQNTDPASKWYGIWGYYLEEPPEKMQPADWNWADFNGSLLLLIFLRHRPEIPESLRPRILESIRHAAASVRRRNVTMKYTNIAVMGTFVTLAASELLEDRDLGAYALERVKRFAAAVDYTSTFYEYNSPTYGQVTVERLTCIRMLVKNPEALRITERIHNRMWEHIAAHWDAPARQLAGPMSRCYSTDIGRPLWMQKALRGSLAFTTLDEIRKEGGPGMVGVVDYRCPEPLKGRFLEPGRPRQHREVFDPGDPAQSAGAAARSAAPRPLQGTTCLTHEYSLGSANRSDFWIQRRPLLAYWGGGQRPARFLQLRFVKDEYDFCSALFYSVQSQSSILGAVNFRNPGGDKHPSLDPVVEGEFRASRLFLQFLIAQWDGGCRVLVDGKPVEPARDGAAEFPPGARFTLQLQGCRMCITPRISVFGKSTAAVFLRLDGAALSLELQLHRSDAPGIVRWNEIRKAIAGFTLHMDRDRESLEKYDARRARERWSSEDTAGRSIFRWAAPDGALELTAGNAVQTVRAQDEAFDEKVNGKSVPLSRLSSEKILA